MSENIKYITDASFDSDVLKSDKPVLVDFWAEWCGPCKMIAPILEEVAKEYDGKVQVAKMDVDANQVIPAKFGIRGIPTLILFKNGVPAAQKVGAMAKGQLTAFIDRNILLHPARRYARTAAGAIVQQILCNSCNSSQFPPPPLFFPSRDTRYAPI